MECVCIKAGMRVQSCTVHYGWPQEADVIGNESIPERVQRAWPGANPRDVLVVDPMGSRKDPVLYHRRTHRVTTGTMGTGPCWESSLEDFEARVESAYAAGAKGGSLMKRFVIIVVLSAASAAGSAAAANLGLLGVGEDTAAGAGAIIGAIVSFLDKEADKRLPDGVGRDPETGRFISMRNGDGS